MKKLFVLCLLCMIFLNGRADEYVGGWRIVGVSKGNEAPSKVDQDAINLMWIQVEDDDIVLYGSYRDINEIKLKNPIYKGKHKGHDIFTFDFVDEEGELFIMLEEKIDGISILSFLQNKRDFSVWAVPLDLDELTFNLEALVLTVNMINEYYWDGTLQENYKLVLEMLGDNEESSSETAPSEPSKPSTVEPTPKPTAPTAKPSEPTAKPSEPEYGKIKISGYTDIWSSYTDRHSKNSMGSLTLETRPSHYMEILHNNNATNLTVDDKAQTKWSTRNGAINVKLPAGATLSNTDEVICWEKTYPNSKDRQQVLFIWDKASKHFQCIRNFWVGSKLTDTYYFSCYDASVWPKIRDSLMQELPYCAERIY